MKLREFFRRKRTAKERGRAQVRFEKHFEVFPGELGDIELNRAKAQALREQAKKRNG